MFYLKRTNVDQFCRHPSNCFFSFRSGIFISGAFIPPVLLPPLLTALRLNPLFGRWKIRGTRNNERNETIPFGRILFWECIPLILSIFPPTPAVDKIFFFLHQKSALVDLNLVSIACKICQQQCWRSLPPPTTISSAPMEGTMCSVNLEAHRSRIKPLSYYLVLLQLSNNFPQRPVVKVNISLITPAFIPICYPRHPRYQFWRIRSDHTLSPSYSFIRSCLSNNNHSFYNYNYNTIPLVDELKPFDPDYKAKVEDSFTRQGLMQFLGVKLTQVKPGFVEMRLDYKPEFRYVVHDPTVYLV